MKVLVITPNIRNSREDGGLVDDLIGELASRGAAVTVLDGTPDRPPGPSAWEGVQRVYYGSGFFSSLRFPQIVKRIIHILAWHIWAVRNRTSFDLALFFSPGLLAGWIPNRLRRSGRASEIKMILWDFFPVHQIEISRLPKWASWPLKKVERKAIDAADQVLVMSPANLRFLERYHPGLKATTRILPPWGGRNVVPQLSGGKGSKFSVVFGGQMVRGRGVDTLLEAARLLLHDGQDIVFQLYGDGHDLPSLQAYAQHCGLSNVNFNGRVTRDEYLARITSCHVGVAVTVPGVSIPSFPSKIVDYCRAGLGVVACLEETTDAGQIVEARGVGVATRAGDAAGLARALRFMCDRHKQGTWAQVQEAAIAWYKSELCTAAAVDRILS